MERLKLVLLVGGPTLPEDCANFFYSYNQKIINNCRVIVMMASKSDIQKGWDGIMGKADLVVDFGGYAITRYNPNYKHIPILTWSGNDKETMTRMMAYI